MSRQSKEAIRAALAAITYVTVRRAAEVLYLSGQRLSASANPILPARLGRDRMIGLAAWLEGCAELFTRQTAVLRAAAKDEAPTRRWRRRPPSAPAAPEGGE